MSFPRPENSAIHNTYHSGGTCRSNGPCHLSGTYHSSGTRLSSGICQWYTSSHGTCHSSRTTTTINLKDCVKLSRRTEVTSTCNRNYCCYCRYYCWDDGYIVLTHSAEATILPARSNGCRSAYTVLVKGGGGVNKKKRIQHIFVHRFQQ